MKKVVVSFYGKMSPVEMREIYTEIYQIADFNKSVERETLPRQISFTEEGKLPQKVNGVVVWGAPEVYILRLSEMFPDICFVAAEKFDAALNMVEGKASIK